MSWNCTQCGTANLNSQTCTRCGAPQPKGAYPVEGVPYGQVSGATASQSPSDFVRFFAGIGYTFLLLTWIIGLFSGSGAIIGPIQRFDELNPGCLYLYALLGLVILFVLILGLCGLFNIK